MRRWSAREDPRLQLDAGRGVPPADDRVVLPIGSTEQHGYLSLETDNILAERVSAEAAEPLGVLVLPVLAYGLTPSFAAYPGSPTLRLETFLGRSPSNCRPFYTASPTSPASSTGPARTVWCSSIVSTSRISTPRS